MSFIYDERIARKFGWFRSFKEPYSINDVTIFKGWWRGGGGKGFCDKYNINFTLYYQFELGDPPLT